MGVCVCVYVCGGAALTTEDKKAAMRQLINEYMSRAEVLKDWVTQQRASLRASSSLTKVCITAFIVLVQHALLGGAAS